MQAATTLTGYLGCLLHIKSHRTARTLATKKHKRERRTDGEEKKGEQREPGTTEEAKESESGEVSEREREPGEILGEALQAKARSLLGHAAGGALEDWPRVLPVKC